MRHRPTLFVEDALPGDDVVLDVADAFGGLLADAVGQVLLEERAHFLAERVFFRCEAKVHGVSPSSCAGLTRASIASRWSHFSWIAGSSPAMTIKSVNLEQPRRAHAAADAHGDDRMPGAAPLAFDQDMPRHARPAHTERMADGDRATVHVYPLHP